MMEAFKALPYEGRARFRRFTQIAKIGENMNVRRFTDGYSGVVFTRIYPWHAKSVLL